jgi:pre-mRNA-splicing factor RBM22/SLT11
MSKEDFPILCETCLGDNPLVRMTREALGAACKSCERPFNVYRWKPGPKARYKRTEVCPSCARLKNICQTCILDLQYGLPVEVRDRYLAQAAKAVGMTSALGSGTAALVSIATQGGMSESNRNFAISQAERALSIQDTATASSTNMVTAGKMNSAASLLPEAHEQLLRLGRNRANYSRNEAKLCSFFAKGECTRGDECPYRHEMPRDKDDPLLKQNIKDRFFGTNDPVAAKLLGKLANRNALEGKDEESNIEGHIDVKNTLALNPPEDQSITTLFISGIEQGTSDEDLRQVFSSLGALKSLRLFAEKGIAFIEYISRTSAETAIMSLSLKAPIVNGRVLRVSWSRPRGGGGGVGSTRSGPMLLGAASDPSLARAPLLIVNNNNDTGVTSESITESTMASSKQLNSHDDVTLVDKNEKKEELKALGVAPWASALANMMQNMQTQGNSSYLNVEEDTSAVGGGEGGGGGGPLGRGRLHSSLRLAQSAPYPSRRNDAKGHTE